MIPKQSFERRRIGVGGADNVARSWIKWLFFVKIDRCDPTESV
jgi:hypothetical protein